MTKRTNRERIVHEAKELGRDFVGVDEWKRSKLGYLTGFSAFITAGKRVARPNIFFGRAIGKMAKAAFGKEEIVKLPTDADDPFERFLVARHVYGVDDFRLRDRCRATHNMAFAMFMVSLACFVYGTVFFADLRGSLPGLLGYLFPFLMLFPSLMMFLRASFWNYQVRHEALYSFGHFLRSGELLAISPKLNRDREHA